MPSCEIRHLPGGWLASRYTFDKDHSLGYSGERGQRGTVRVYGGAAEETIVAKVVIARNGFIVDL